MKLRFRLAAIVLGLVIVPTAMLSLVASRAMRNWGLILEARAEREAANTVDAVVNRVDARLADDMEQVRATVGEALSAGGDAGAVGRAAARLHGTRPLVHQVYVFMDGVGFIWPQAEPDSGEQACQLALGAALRERIGGGWPSSHAVPLTVEKASYFFSRVPGSRVVYVGYEIDHEEFRAVLASVVRDLAHTGLALAAQGMGLSVASPIDDNSDDVLVSDSLGMSTHVAAAQAPIGELIGSGELSAPFSAITVRAYARDPERNRRMVDLQSQLAVWGIFLLAAGVAFGTLLIVWETSTEVRRARARSDFVIGVSHDLRTPVASMKVLAESLQMDRVKDPQKRGQFLDTLVSETNRLGQLIERVLFFVRFGQDAIAYSPREEDLGGVVVNSVAVFAGQHRGQREGTCTPGDREAGKPVSRAPSRSTSAEAMGVQFTFPATVPPRCICVSVAGGLPPMAVDAQALTQVMLNLLDNAWKYGVPVGDTETCRHGDTSSDGGAHVDVDVHVRRVTRRRRRWRPEQPCVEIAVRDHGQGLGRHEQRRVFHRYYRGRGAADRNTSGVGLGLALCEHVARAHGGWMTVDGAPGRGCVFRLVLPVG